MSQTSELLTIMKDLENAYVKARKHILKRLPEHIPKFKATRYGDFNTPLDSEVYEIYANEVEHHNMLIYCEEDEKDKDGSIDESIAEDHEYFMLLDPIDGTVNLFSNLTCGVNIALGRIGKNSTVFTIGDIQAVFVADYVTGKKFTWVQGGKMDIRPPKIEGVELRKHEKCPALIFEMPDAASYLFPDDKQGMNRQRRLLSIFYELFRKMENWEVQRRAIDCTGLRMLEVADKNSVAYADVRGATRPWDTVPSIKLLLEQKDFVVLDDSFQRYNQQSTIFEIKNGKVRLNKDLGKTVIVVHKNELSQLSKFKQRFMDATYPEPKGRIKPKNVFIVHGHDNEAKLDLKNYLQNTLFDVVPTILHEQPNRGRAIIEKFEGVSEDTDIAFVLLTPDDLGATKDGTEDDKRRARQNVIFEMGYFFGKLQRRFGRGQVVLCHKGPIELPGDIDGLLYIDVSGGAEKASEKFRNELKERWIFKD